MAQAITGQAQGIVLTASQKAGSPAAVSTGWHNELLKSDLLARYAYLNLSAKVFSVGNTAFAALTAVGTAVTGLTLFNPANSGVNLVILDLEVAFTPVTITTLAVAAVLVGVSQPATPTGVAVLTPSPALVGSAATPSAKAYSAATITAGALTLRVVGNYVASQLTSGGSVGVALLKDEIAGAVIVQPGALVCLAGVGTVASATVAASATWAELPI